MSTFRPYKFQLVAIVQEVNDDGQVIGEATMQDGEQPITVYGVEALARFAQDFPVTLEKTRRQPAT